MKGLVFVVAAALACCVTTCAALKCRSCTLKNTKGECEKASLTTCTQSTPVCWTTQTKLPVIGEKWNSRCQTKTACETARQANPRLCKPTQDTFTCQFCCSTDGCVGGASAARISVVAMATAALAVLLKNAAGF
ncbi:uncharacterized protein LOC144918869 isoform X3 [Branchiostoma floridae x Branchiostoma belcheri]